MSGKTLQAAAVHNAMDHRPSRRMQNSGCVCQQYRNLHIQEWQHLE